jgi:predicted transcriptional regulator of viral defense system
MSKSTYISKSLTKSQIDFLNKINEQEILYFSLDDIQDKLGESTENLNEIVENLCDKKLIKRIERSKYAINSFNDSYVLSTYIANGGVVAYWSALHLHGLTERFPNKIFIKIRGRKREANIFGARIQFVSVKDNKMIGNIYRGYGDEKFPLSDVEMTLIDCFDQRRYAGDFADLLRAFNRAEIKSSTLIKYLMVYKNAALIKRMGFLAEIYQKKELSNFLDFAKDYPLSNFALFDSRGINAGEYSSKWKLRLNINKVDILGIINEAY